MNKLKVELLGLNDLTEREREDFGGDPWVNYLRVTHDKKPVFLVSDQMEPEDASFNRDLSWVITVIEKAYSYGVKDGRDE